jgi:tRNA A37 threonylcarbamoyltransferase TsaD
MNIVTSEFNITNLDYLQETLLRLNLPYTILGNAEAISFSGIKVDLVRRRAELTPDRQRVLNNVKVEYARTCIEHVAKKKRWVIKNVNRNTLKLRRY